MPRGASLRLLFFSFSDTSSSRSTLKGMPKVCTKCKHELENSAFYKNRNRKDGLSAWCKKCSKAKNQSDYQTNKAKIAERSKAYYKKNREQVLARAKAYTEEHKQEVLTRSREWRNVNLEHCKQRDAQYFQEHKQERIEKQRALFIEAQEKQRCLK